MEDHMASIQSKKGRGGKKTHYVVVPLGGRRRWIKAGTMKDVHISKRLLLGQNIGAFLHR
jgi:hypothetical protein